MKLLGMNIELNVDLNGKLRVAVKGTAGAIYVVEGFKKAVYKEKEYIFPILKIEIPKK